jgi:rubredoxin
MTIKAAKDVFDKEDFQADKDWELLPQTAYECSVCKEKVVFSLKDLDKHAFSRSTNLSREHAERIESLIRISQLGGFNSFIDFYCPTCQRPIRVYYQSWAGGRFTHGHHLQYVID